MASAKKEKIGVDMLVQPRLDPKAVSKLERDTTDLYKKLSKIKVTWNQVTKSSTESLGEIHKISTAASAFAGSLSDAAKSSFKELSKLGDKLEEAHNKAASLGKEIGKAKTPGARKSAATELGATKKTIIGLNKEVDTYRKTNHKYEGELEKTIKSQKKFQTGLDKMKEYTSMSFMKDIATSMKGVAGGGRHEIASAGSGIARALSKKYASNKIKAAGGSDTPSGAKMAEGMASSITELAGAAAVLGVVVKFIAAASDHMADLNKSLLEGSTLAGDSAKSVSQYSTVLKSLRDTSIGLNTSWMKFGMTSKESLSALAVFSKETSGSLSQTQARLEAMGSGFSDPLKKGMQSFVIAAKVYGNALGMSMKDTAGIMGTLVNEIGVQSDNVQKIMGGIVHQAAASNIPVYKFMDMFREALPNLDLYINRIEELTGVMKLLGSAMSPKDIKQFIQAFSQGFDKMDFKQRLHIALVAGIGNTSKILEGSFQAAGKGLATAMGSKFGPQFEKAMKKSHPVKEVRKVMAAAMASGDVSSATIDSAQGLARSERGRRKGGATNIAYAMRGAGLMARLKILKLAADKYTHGNIEGLGEEVAKKMAGINEAQYKGILHLEDAMGDYNDQLIAVGRTSNKSINENLKKILFSSGKISDKSDSSMEKYMKNLAKTNHKSSESLVEQAATMHITSNSKKTADITDLTAKQVDATLGIGDKIDNVVGTLLEKLYWVINEMFGWLESDLWGWLTKSGEKASKQEGKYLRGQDQQFKSIHGNDAAKMTMFSKIQATLKDLNNSGANTNDILGQSQNILMSARPDTIKDAARVGFKGDDASKFSKLMLKGAKRSPKESRKLDSMLKGMDPKILLTMLSFMGREESSRATGDIELGHKHTVRKLMTKKEVGAQNTALDQRTKFLFSQLHGGKKKPGGVTTLTPVTITSEVAKKMATASGKPGPKPSLSSPEGRALNQSQKNQVATEKSGEFVSRTVDKHAKKQYKQSQQLYNGITSVAGILKEGIIFQPGFLMGPYKSSIKDATFSSFQKALIGFAVLQAKMDEHPGFKKSMSDWGWQTMDSGVGLKKLSTVGKDDYTHMDKWLKKNAPGRQMGGPVHDTGMYKLHKGEAVLDPMTYGTVKRGLRDGGSGKNAVTVNIHAAPNWTPQQFENAVVNVMDRVNRRQ